MTPDPAEVVRGLSWAACDWISAPETYADPNTIRALRRKGIVADHCLKLTVLGLACRQLLSQTPLEE